MAPTMERPRSAPLTNPKDGDGGAPRSFALRLAGMERCTSRADRHDVVAPSPSEPTEFAPAALPAGTGSGAADPDNPFRIDSFAAIAASLDGDTRAIFDEAVHLLRSLQSGRAEVEAKLRETGRVDPIREVTGVSALDGAIERTQEMIRLLGEMRHLADEADRV